MAKAKTTTAKAAKRSAPETPCPHCGKGVHPRAKECPHCGKAIVREQAAKKAAKGNTGVDLTAVFKVVQNVKDYVEASGGDTEQAKQWLREVKTLVDSCGSFQHAEQAIDMFGTKK
jgi:predicted RNA-binding Zn-ribbon protein involved in translation (DUF1610 family)